jgi:hypothetical protein
MGRFAEFRSKLTTAGSMLQPLYVISPSCSVWNYKIPTRAADFVDSPNASSRSVMFLITSPKNECTLVGQLTEGVYSTARIDAVYRYLH